MLFTSIEFVVFLPIVLLAYLACPRRMQNTLLLAASYVFYGWWDTRFLGLLMLSTVLDFTTARALARLVDSRRRRWLMAGYVSASLGILGTFKYFDFFVETIPAMPHIVLDDYGIALGLDRWNMSNQKKPPYEVMVVDSCALVRATPRGSATRMAKRRSQPAAALSKRIR